MLELPEAVTLASQFEKAYQGKVITRAVAGHTPHKFAFYEGDPADYSSRLEGKTVGGSASFGGHAMMIAGDMRLGFSDGVNARYLAPDEERPAKHQLLLDFDDGSSLVCTISMYGFFGLCRADDQGNEYFQAAKGKPSPLSDAFDAAYFEGLFSNTKPTLSAKAFLATEQRVPGLGNGVLQDILFRAGIHPKTKTGVLDGREKKLLFDAVKSTLIEMARGGGRDTEKDLYGQAGGYRTILSRNTLDKPCPVCGGALIREAYLGGNIYFCPGCQPMKK